MNGKDKMLAALSKEGTPEIPAVICYEGIFIRDHWDELSSYPWWYQFETDIDKQISWRHEVMERIDQDWTSLPTFYSNEEQSQTRIELCNDEVYLVNSITSTNRKLTKPHKSGWNPNGGVQSLKPKNIIQTKDDIDQLIYPVDLTYPERFAKEGRNSLSKLLLKNSGSSLFPIVHISSPLWYCYQIWGFEGMMLALADHLELIRYACEKFLEQRFVDIKIAKALGAQGIWVEECFTDMISPEHFKEINVPLITQMTEAIRAEGMSSIYYYCGNPADRLDLILSCQADAISLEESKKGFHIDIDDVVDYVSGRCTVLGNLDTYDVLEKGTPEQLEHEVKRQIKAGKRNHGRFIMSLGSPVTPDTSVSRVRLYCDMVHELGKNA
ncbi:MAG TPA: hypothetical protein DDZ89_06205 [Clostridiales bacterium]|nr:hypothetical protein [Clostridiales bacterium]